MTTPALKRERRREAIIWAILSGVGLAGEILFGLSKYWMMWPLLIFVGIMGAWFFWKIWPVMKMPIGKPRLPAWERRSKFPIVDEQKLGSKTPDSQNQRASEGRP